MSFLRFNQIIIYHLVMSGIAFICEVSNDCIFVFGTMSTTDNRTKK